MFLFAMRSPKTREKCKGRLRMFFDFVGILPGEDMEDRSKAFSTNPSQIAIGYLDA